jgi:hypothetical protein
MDAYLRTDLPERAGAGASNGYSDIRSSLVVLDVASDLRDAITVEALLLHNPT